MKIGLLFGSFNPIHIGHIAIAKYMSEFTDLQQVWFVVSPHNPLKDKNSLSDAKKRFASVKKAVGKYPDIKVSNIEFGLPVPSYTIHTLEKLTKKYSRHNFVLIIGSDNLGTFYKWKEYKKILANHTLYVYPRSGFNGGKLKNHRNVKMMKAPRIDISSTFIRAQLKKGKSVRHLIPAN